MSKDLQILSTDIGPSWFVALKDVFTKDWFRKLNDFVLREREADLYQQLVDQFISESYGDRVFSFFLILHTTNIQPTPFR